MRRIEHLADGVTCILEDCREVDIPNVDVCITDPPYAEKTHAGARTGGGDEFLIDFASITDAEFVAFCERFSGLAARWVIMTCDWRHAAEVERRLPDLFIRAGVWIKPNGMPQYTAAPPGKRYSASRGQEMERGFTPSGKPKVHGDHPTGKPCGSFLTGLLFTRGETPSTSG
jgi:hypothetical protein